MTKKRILIVDDNLENLHIAMNVLSVNKNLDFTYAVDGKSALTIINNGEQPFDLILLDVMMEGLDGFDLCKYLKASHLKEVPIIFVTAKTDLNSIRRGFNLGCVDYITKPYHPLELQVRVDCHLQLFEARKQLHYFAHYDALTNIPNRRYFYQRAEEELSRSLRYQHPLSLILLDIDHFKKINDSYGHDIGDECLKHVASSLVNSSRDIDLVARQGGEEFVVLLPETNKSHAQEVAERLRRDIAKLELTDSQDKPLSLTASIGISSLSSEHNSNIDVLISQADKALYKAKNMGRNKVCTY